MENLDVSFLIGSRMQQLALGMYEFQLVFETSHISVRQKLHIKNPNASVLEIQADRPEQTKDLYFLLGATIKDASIDDTKTLKLIFDNQCKITIDPSANGQDSFIVWSKDRCITI